MLLIGKKEQHFTAHLYGHVEIAKVLLENGADVNAVENKRTALWRTCWRYERVDSERCWCECCWWRQCLCSGRNVEIAKVLIQNDADVNAVQKDNWTALQIAVIKRCIPVYFNYRMGAKIDDAIKDDGPYLTDRKQIEIASWWKSTLGQVYVRRGETFHVESCLCLDSKASGDCIYNIPEDSFVRHISRYFMGPGYNLRR